MHSNNSSPAFAVNKHNGSYICFNPACDKAGSLISLVKKTTYRNDYETLRFIGKYTKEIDVVAALERSMQKVELKPIDPEILQRLQDAFAGSEGESYMLERGFSSKTLADFGIGWSQKRKSVIVPMHSPDGICVGWQARSIERKQFSFWRNTPRSHILFNLHNAKRHGGRGIIVEAPFDAMRISQAGFPNVVAVAGGHLATPQHQLLAKHFTEYIHFIDNDYKPPAADCKRCSPKGIVCKGHFEGEEFSNRIIEQAPDKEHYWIKLIAGKKDACDMTDDEIREAIVNRQSHFERQLAQFA